MFSPCHSEPFIFCHSEHFACCHSERSEESQITAQRILREESYFPMKRYYVYIMTNQSKTLYTGVTSNIIKRIYEHKHKLVPGFTKKYNITKLVYVEEFDDIRYAIQREKQIKGWVRKRKMSLIESMNPKWYDISKKWYEEQDSSVASLPQNDSEVMIS